MVDASILGSEWVYVKPEGGNALKPGAPDEIKKQFEEYKRALAATKTSAREAVAAVEKDLEETETFGDSR